MHRIHLATTLLLFLVVYMTYDMKLNGKNLKSIEFF